MVAHRVVAEVVEDRVVAGVVEVEASSSNFCVTGTRPFVAEVEVVAPLFNFRRFPVASVKDDFNFRPTSETADETFVGTEVEPREISRIMSAITSNPARGGGAAEDAEDIGTIDDDSTSDGGDGRSIDDDLTVGGGRECHEY